MCDICKKLEQEYDAMPLPQSPGSVKRHPRVECPVCFGSSFKQDGDDFICLSCGAIIDGPWPAWATEPSPSPSADEGGGVNRTK